MNYLKIKYFKYLILILVTYITFTLLVIPSQAILQVSAYDFCCCIRSKALVNTLNLSVVNEVQSTSPIFSGNPTPKTFSQTSSPFSFTPFLKLVSFQIRDK